MLDFPALVLAGLEALAAEDAALARQQAEAARRRAELALERKSLEAARAAYERVRTTPPPSAARRSRTGAAAFLRAWAHDHGGTVALAEATPAAAAAGFSADQVRFATRSLGDFDRVARGVYRSRAEAVS